MKVISENFDVPQLKTTRRIWIYLPKDYKTSRKKYEVFYLQDAQNLFDVATSYAGEWQVDETLNKIFEKTGKSVLGHTYLWQKIKKQTSTNTAGG